MPPPILRKNARRHRGDQVHQKSFVVGMLLAAASFLQPAFAVDPHATYRCEDGSHFFVRFSGDAADVTLSDGTKLSLPQQRAASGIWYSSGRYDLRGKGREATWTVGRKVPVKCVSSG
jgi:membrane-bound inhibitor of C-type lysozyme